MSNAAVAGSWRISPLDVAAYKALDLKRVSATDLENAGIELDRLHNRYPDVLPNANTRVILAEDEKDPKSTYINANFVRGPEGQRARYIACQGCVAFTNEHRVMAYE